MMVDQIQASSKMQDSGTVYLPEIFDYGPILISIRKIRGIFLLWKCSFQKHFLEPISRFKNIYILFFFLK